MNDDTAPQAGVTGMLHIVATPIGNLGDFPPRAISTLQSVALVLAEDTRHSRKLFLHFGIDTPLQAWHSHNEGQQLAEVLRRLQHGQDLALISDAGMPLISDPGFSLVRACHEAGIPVSVVPGPSACLAALAISGLPADRFAFEGFLPPRSAARQQRLRTLVAESRTLIFYEAPHRMAATLADVVAVFGPDRAATIARELTKRYESVYRGSTQEMAVWAQGEGADRRGEFVLLIAPAPDKVLAAEDELPEEVVTLAHSLRAELPPRRVAKLLGRHYQVPSARIYDLLVAASDQDE